jgi:hypothetical protein
MVGDVRYRTCIEQIDIGTILWSDYFETCLEELAGQRFRFCLI